MNLKTTISGLIVLLTAAALTACNKDAAPARNAAEGKDTIAIDPLPKVLYIIIDGGRGESVNKIAPANLMTLKANAIYSWNSLTDTLGVQAASWAGMLTGVGGSRHQVINNDFSGNNLAAFPPFTKLVKSRLPEYPIRFFGASKSLLSNLSTGSDKAVAFENDDPAVKNAVLAALAEDTAGLIIAQFGSVNAAGAAYGYDASVPQYRDAVGVLDGYVGEMLGKLRARKGFAGEKWLVVVTSSMGGNYPVDPQADDNSIFSKPLFNTFTIVYSPTFKPLFLDRPFNGTKFSGSAVRLFGKENAIFATVPGAIEEYNFGDTTSFTVELNIKVNKRSDGSYNYTYPSVFSKRATFTSGVPGWLIFLENNFWQVNFGQVGKGNVQAKGAVIGDGKWHNIAVTVLGRGGKRYVRTFTDGKFGEEKEITGQGNINSPAPLTMGRIPGSDNIPADVYMAEVRIFKTAIPDSVIARDAGSIRVGDDHPYLDYLLGYWPATDGAGSVFRDKSPLRRDFVLQGSPTGKYTWVPFSTILNPPAVSNLESLVPAGKDLPLLLLTWLNITPEPGWQLEGRVWLTGLTGVK
ncbi:LamG-like jellyroll fold domain-containing protein [Chitinophaga lutea]|nr:LamG-like jellyroll fold domain-containing protein [Chitinophaga lutea]